MIANASTALDHYAATQSQFTVSLKCVCVYVCRRVFLKSLKYFATTVRDKFTSSFYFEVTYLLLILGIYKSYNFSVLYY